MFDKLDFKNINYIKFDDSFNIKLEKKSKIIFGYNGIGKTTIYKYLKEKYKEYDYLDYDESEKSFLKSKKEVVIGARIQTITKLKSEIDQLKSDIDLDGILKKYDYGSQVKSKKVSDNLANIQKTKEIEKITLSKEEINIANEIVYEEIRKNFFDKYREIIKVANIKDEMEYLKNFYMTKAYQSLINSIDSHETTCPTCNTHGIHNLKEIIKQKKEDYEGSSKSVFGDFKFKEEIDREKQIKKLIELAKSLDDTKISELLICDFDNERRKKLIKIIDEINTKKSQIEKLQERLKEYYKNIKKEEKDIKEYFENRFDIEKLQFDDKENKIIIKFKRPVDTYSEGEIHLIILLFKLYEFRINDSDKLIIDDPLTSYDLINQYKTLFEIVNTVSDDKKILIFTHNIEMINIVNSQNSKVFEYQYIEKYLGKLYLENIDLKASGSVLCLNNLLELDDNGYLKLLIEREKEENKNYHKVFHYDTSYVLNDKLFNGLTNEYFVEIIEKFEEKKVKNESFKKNIYNKIIYMCAIRVWIEKKFYENFCTDMDIMMELLGKTFSEKINIIFPKNSKSLLLEKYPELTREFLMSKKVMLNQNEHYLSQIIPFNYALNISLDDLIYEIDNIKQKFIENDGGGIL